MDVIDKKKYKGLPAGKKHHLYGQPLSEAVRLLATGEVWARHAAQGVVAAHLESLQSGREWLTTRPHNQLTATMRDAQERDIRLLRQALQLDWRKQDNRLKVVKKLACVSYYRRTCDLAVKQERNASTWL